MQRCGATNEVKCQCSRRLWNPTHGPFSRFFLLERRQFRRIDLDTLLAVRHSIELRDKVRFFLCHPDRKMDAALPVLACRLKISGPRRDNPRNCAQNKRRRYGGEEAKLCRFPSVGPEKAFLGGCGLGCNSLQRMNLRGNHFNGRARRIGVVVADIRWIGLLNWRRCCLFSRFFTFC